jgi:hypothetical protein
VRDAGEVLEARMRRRVLRDAVPRRR